MSSLELIRLGRELEFRHRRSSTLVDPNTHFSSTFISESTFTFGYWRCSLVLFKIYSTRVIWNSTLLHLSLLTSCLTNSLYSTDRQCSCPTRLLIASDNSTLLHLTLLTTWQTNSTYSREETPSGLWLMTLLTNTLVAIDNSTLLHLTPQQLERPTLLVYWPDTILIVIEDATVQQVGVYSTSLDSTNNMTRLKHTLKYRLCLDL
jgi:hypothetical protein